MNNNLEKLKTLVSDKKSGWLEKATYHQDNKAWLDVSFAIAVKILASLRANKQTSTFPENQKQLADAMNCSPQYVNKLLKGTENLQLETITKIEKILGINLIQVPQFEKTITLQPNVSLFAVSEKLSEKKTNTSFYREVNRSVLYVAEPNYNDYSYTG